MAFAAPIIGSNLSLGAFYGLGGTGAMTVVMTPLSPFWRVFAGWSERTKGFYFAVGETF